ncbi:MAG: flippase-like domain-containing protein [Anaerolineae bacterium]|jgi:hypothetical protein|nr:flippase-like domain-containing protein [Anaerolineae bacterium]
MTRRQQLLAALGVIISAIFLWFAFSGLQPQAVIASLQNVNPLGLVIGMAVYTLAMVAITWRWQFLLRSLTPVSVRDLYQLVAIGYMGNNVYPLRAGEILRIYLLRRDHGVAYLRGTTTVLVERVFDGIVMLTFILLPLTFIPNTSPEIRNVATLGAVIFVSALIVFLVLALRPTLTRQLITFVTRLLPSGLGHRIQDLGEEVITGLGGLRSTRDLIGTIFASYLSWMIEAGVYWIVAGVFGLPVGYAMMLMVVGVVNLAGLVPASPGQLGVFEFFASRVLMGFGIAQSQALAFAFVVHVVIWLPPTLLGGFFLIRRGLGFGTITRAQRLKDQEINDQDDQQHL